MRIKRLFDWEASFFNLFTKVSFISTTCDVAQAKNICKIYVLHFYPLKSLQLCESTVLTLFTINFNNDFAITHVRYFGLNSRHSGVNSFSKRLLLFVTAFNSCSSIWFMFLKYLPQGVYFVVIRHIYIYIYIL